jgi:hypothetical protein
MAHSCWHCQQYILVQPRLDEEAYWVDVLEVEHQLVVHGASNGCAFFNWCLLQRPEPPLREDHKNKVVLRGYMWAGVTSKGFAGRRFLSLRWETGPAPVEIHLRDLHIMAELGRYRPSNCIASVTKASKAILRTVISRCDP